MSKDLNLGANIKPAKLHIVGSLEALNFTDRDMVYEIKFNNSEDVYDRSSWVSAGTRINYDDYTDVFTLSGVPSQIMGKFHSRNNGFTFTVTIIGWYQWE